MMKIFTLPDLGEGLPDAEIREWYIKAGDEIRLDQPIVAMETAKAVVDVPAPRSGKVIKLYGKAGDVIKTGSPLIEFEEGENVPAKGTVVGDIQEGNTVLEESATGIKPQTNLNSSVSIKVIPAIRALAKKLNVDLADITPTGPSNQITVEDVERAANQTNVEKPPSGYQPLRGVRRTMATVMAQSHAEVVPVTIVDDADIHAWASETDITLRVIRALIAGCKAEPALNAWYDSKTMARCLHDEVHIGIAMDSVEGLFVPVLKHADKNSKENLRHSINRFKEQVKARTIPQDDLKGATILISNVGIFAGRYANPIIVPPTVAIVATGRIREEVIPFQGKPDIHRVLPLSLTMDHRAITGGEAARFLAAMIEDLQTAN